MHELSAVLRRFSIPLCTAFLAVIASSPADCAGLKTDAQLWQEVDLVAPLGPNVTATMLGVMREGDSLPNPALAAGGATFDFRAGAWTFTGGDLWAAARSPVSGTGTDVDLPLAALSYSWSWAGISISERNRFEQLIGLPGDPWRYRNRLAFEMGVEGFGRVSGVFASDEVFYDLQKDRWSRNRAQIGFEIPLAHSAALQLYYMRQDDSNARLSALNIAGTTLKVNLW